MTVAASPKSAGLSKEDAIRYLERLAKELTRLGFAGEADRAREIAGEIRTLRG